MTTTLTKLKEQTDDIMDLFSGADGGAGFVKFKRLTTTLAEKAEAGDPAAQQVMEVVARFHRLVKLAEGL